MGEGGVCRGEKKVHRPTVRGACGVSRRRARPRQTTLTLCLGEVTRRPKVKRKMGHMFTAPRSSAGHAKHQNTFSWEGGGVLRADARLVHFSKIRLIG